MTPRVLVTGGLGYLGGRVSAHLSRQGFTVRLGTTRPMERTPGWAEGVGEVCRLDVLNDADLASAVSNVEAIVHLAALNEVDAERDPERALQVNSLGTLKLLRAASRAGVRRLIYFSTAHVYGAPLVGRLTETSMARPVHPYAITHRTAEDFVLAAHDRGQLEAAVFRLSNGFGAPCDALINRWTLIANDLCRQAVSTGRLALRTSGLQQRDFIPLADVACATEHFLRLDRSALLDGIFNIGGGRSLSVYELATRIAKRAERLLGRQVSLVRPEPAAGETAPTLEYVVGKAAAAGFAPMASLDDEIDATLRVCHEAERGGVWRA